MENNYKERLNNAAERLRESAKYEFLLPASELDVRAFEAKFDVRLPEDYRWFITNVANAIKAVGTGDFGFLEEKNWADYWFEEDEFNPAKPFPLTQRVLFYRTEPRSDDVYPYETICDYDNNLYPDGYRFGEISLVGAGCGADCFLVVNGEEYGYVWIDNPDSGEEVLPAYDRDLDKNRLTFTDWFCMRLRRLEKLRLL